MLKTIIILLCSAFYFVDIDFYSWHHHFYYMLCHGNIFHLSGNMYAMYLLFNENRYRYWEYIPVVYIFSVMCSYVMCLHVVGFSAPLFVYMGMIFTVRKWQMTAFTFLLSLLLPNISFATHAICFLLGLAYRISRNYIIEIYNDCRRIGI